MIKYSLKRLIQAVPLLLIVTLITFCLIQLAPFDAIDSFVTPSMSAETIAGIKEREGLNKPVVLQYFYWLKNIFQGDFGYSLIGHQNIGEALAEKIPNTLSLILPSYLSALLLALLLGLYAGVHAEDKKGKLINQLCMVGISTPTFWVAMLVIYFFGYRWSLLPIIGMGTAGEANNFKDFILHFLLPYSVLIIAFVPDLVLHGGHVSLFVGFTAMLVSTLIGTTTGLIAGYFGGRLDNLLMRIVDIFSSVPWMILTVVLSVLLKPGMSTIILVISLFSWMNIARLVRAETLTVKERDFVFYSEFIGVPVTTILIKHISPQIISVITVAAISNLSNAIMMESALSFLGLGIQQPQSSWGSLLESAQSSLQEAPYMAITPGILITVTVLCCNQLASFFQLVFSNEG